MTSDNSLLEKAVAGDQDALAQLLEESGTIVRRSLAAEIPSRWQAVLSIEDVMQQTYIDAFLDLSRFEPRGEGALTAWLMTLAKRNLLDAVRMLEAEKRGRNHRRVSAGRTDQSLVALYEMLGAARTTLSRHAARKEVRSQLEHAIEQLPETYRSVVEMYDIQGRPVDEVAAALHRSPGAVFMLRSRAHRYLREQMGTASLFMSDSR